MSLTDDTKYDFNNPNLKLSTNIDYPLFSLGFHHYIHASKNKMEIIKQFENKKKIYLVMNKFERYVDNYQENIGNYGQSFFNITKGVPNILSRGFYKLWEIFHMFDIIDLKSKNFISAHLAEGPGSFIQATMFFRDKYCNNNDSKNDKYYAVTLHPDDEGKHVPELEKTFVDYYNNEKPKRFIQHKTFSKQVAGGYDDKDCGDLTDPKTIKLFGGNFNTDKADLVTADGGFDWINENTQEQEAFRLIFAQILMAIKIQKKNGHFVCKFFESFSDSTAKLIFLLSNIYEKVYLVKPLTSRPSNSEKYAVCMNYKDNSNTQNIIKIMEQIHTILHNNKNLHIVSIWNNILYPPVFKTTLIHVNKTIANYQLKAINELVDFINAQNYYGDNYQSHRQMQIDANKYWIKLFMPKKENFNLVLNHIRDSTNKIIDKTKLIIKDVKYS